MRFTRRKAIAGIGSIAVAAGAFFSSGAFTQTQIERDVVIDVAQDAEAFVEVEANDGSVSGTSSVAVGTSIDDYGSKGANGIYSTGSQQTLDEYVGDPTTYVTQTNSGVGIDFTAGNADGFNPDGVTVFEDLLRVQNNGSQTVAFNAEVGSQPSEGTLDVIALDGSGNTRSLLDANLSDEYFKLTVDYAGVTLLFDSDSDTQGTSETVSVTIEAEAISP